MVVELRDKLAAMETPEKGRQPAATSGTSADVVSALLNLGYEQHAAEQAVERAGKDGLPESFEALLRATLQQLSAPAQKGARVAR
jgi:Holliday junction resolvasome RuvABC DNA-binding subunit